MSNLTEYNHVEKYIQRQESFNNMLKWALIGFICMAVVIVYYAVSNHELKKDKNQLSLENKSKQAQIDSLMEIDRMVSFNLNDTIGAAKNQVKDSLMAIVQEYKTERDLNINSIRSSYEKLVDKVKSEKTKNLIFSVNREIDTKLETGNKSLNNMYKKMSKVEPLKGYRYNIYIKYLKEKERATFEEYEKYSTQLNKAKNDSIVIAKPTLISYPFESAVKYFYREDKVQANRIAKMYNYGNAVQAKSNYAYKGYIEVWVGN